ncbi:T9SS type A sorting domain-containing protein, partial [bacterium]|nr:T9SS type A sorting domain-containing protein [bacterium]
FPFVKSGAADGSAFVPFIAAGTPNPFERIEGETVDVDDYVMVDSYPNPFNPTTSISYQLSAVSHVTLTVYDIAGREVAKLVDGFRDAGVHEVTFDGSGLASGVYLYRLTTQAQTVSGKMVLMK